MPPRGKGKQSAVFAWTDERKENLLDCWQEIVLANEARPANNRSNKKQLSAELRRQFCARFPECKLAATTLYTYLNNLAHDRPLPASGPTAVWNDETDAYLIECVARAHRDNLHGAQLGLMAGKRGRPSAFRRILIDIFCDRYPDITESSIFKRCTELRKQKRIDDGEPQQEPSPAPAVPVVNVSDIAAGDAASVVVPDETARLAFYQCTMRYWEIGYQFATRAMFVGACSRCAAIMTADSVKNCRKFSLGPVGATGVPAPRPGVYRYYTAAQVKLPVVNANGQWYRCNLCNSCDLLAEYPLAPDTVRNLPLPKCVADLTEPADRRAIALVALHSRTATKRSDALRVFEHLRGEFAVSHREDKTYFAMYAMIVDRYGQHTAAVAASTAGNARILVQRALKWFKVNNPLYRMFAANYETLLRYQPRQRGQPKSLQLFGDAVDFKPVSTALTKLSLLDSEQCGMIVPADNVGARGVPSVAGTVTGAQHVRNYEAATRGHADVCQVTFGDPHLEAKLFPWLLPYGTGGWSVQNSHRALTRGMYIRWRVSMCDARFRREPEYMFFFLDLIVKERIQYYASVRVNVADLETPLTKQQIDRAAQRAKDDPYAVQYGTEMPATIPNSRNYWATKTLDLLAMSTQLERQPDFFITLTENDSWPELQAVICRGLAASHQTDGRKEMEDVHRFGRPAMNHPVETVHAFYNRLQMFRRRVLHNPTGPIGKVQDYFLRIEYQKRGSLHAHLVVWVEPGTIVPQDVVCAEMPRYTEHPRNPDWRHVVESYQMHRCIPSRCLKGKKDKQLTRCKYGFPFAVNCDAVRPAPTGVRFVYLRHDAEDARVIPYNLALLLMWDGHVNIQMVTTGGWELYLAKYVAKSDQATMMSIHSNTGKTNECATYLKGRLVSVLEAATLILQRPHVMCTREVVYLPVATSPKYRMLKRRADMQYLRITIRS